MDCSPVHGLVSSRKDARFPPFESMPTTASLGKKDNILVNIIVKLGPAGSINKDMCMCNLLRIVNELHMQPS